MRETDLFSTINDKADLLEVDLNNEPLKLDWIISEDQLIIMFEILY